MLEVEVCVAFLGVVRWGQLGYLQVIRDDLLVQDGMYRLSARLSRIRLASLPGEARARAFDSLSIIDG